MRSTFLSGFVYYIAVVNLPERFQIVSRDTPIIAGVRLLPMLVFSGLGAILGGFASARHNNTSYTLIIASAFQLLGYGLMTTLGLTTDVPAKQYGFQIFLGLGFGMTMSSATQMMHLQAAPQWLGSSYPTSFPHFPTSPDSTIILTPLAHSGDTRRPRPTALPRRQHRSRHRNHPLQLPQPLLLLPHHRPVTRTDNFLI
jgi:hypothetical protein